MLNEAFLKTKASRMGCFPVDRRIFLTENFVTEKETMLNSIVTSVSSLIAHPQILFKIWPILALNVDLLLFSFGFINLIGLKSITLSVQTPQSTKSSPISQHFTIVCLKTEDAHMSCDNLLESLRKIWHPDSVITDGFTAVHFILWATYVLINWNIFIDASAVY